MEQSAVVEALHQKIRELMRDGAHEPELRYAMHTVSAEIHVKYLRPTPASGPLRLRARVVESSADRATVEATLETNGKVTATCRGVFVAVKEGHPAFHRW